MEMNELIHKLEKARTKDDIEALGKEHLGIDVDKRKAKEVLRAELIGEAESRTSGEAGQTPPTEQPKEPDAEQGTGNPSESGDNDPASTGNPDPEADPESEPHKDPEPEPERAHVKMARNRRSGRVMPWTAAMAKMPHMEEM